MNNNSSSNLKRKNNNENNKSIEKKVAKKLSFEGVPVKKRTEEPTHALVFWTEEEKFSVIKYSSIQSECIQGF